MVCRAAWLFLSCLFSATLLFTSLYTEQNQSNFWFSSNHAKCLSFYLNLLTFTVMAKLGTMLQNIQFVEQLLRDNLITFSAVKFRGLGGFFSFFKK